MIAKGGGHRVEGGEVIVCASCINSYAEVPQVRHGSEEAKAGGVGEGRTGCGRWLYTLAASRAMLRRLDQSSCCAKGGLVRAFLSTSKREPLAQNSVMIQGGSRHIPMNMTTLGWRKLAMMDTYGIFNGNKGCCPMIMLSAWKRNSRCHDSILGATTKDSRIVQCVSGRYMLMM